MGGISGFSGIGSGHFVPEEDDVSETGSDDSYASSVGTPDDDDQSVMFDDDGVPLAVQTDEPEVLEDKQDIAEVNKETVKIFGRVNKKNVDMDEIKSTYVDPTANMGRFQKMQLRNSHINLFGLAARYDRARTPEQRRDIEARIQKELSKYSDDPAARNALLTMRAPNGETFLETLTRKEENYDKSFDLVERLLTNYATADVDSLAINQFNADGRTMLHKAAENNRASLVTLLQRLGADPEIATTKETPARILQEEYDLAVIDGQEFARDVEDYLELKKDIQAADGQEKRAMEQKLQNLMREIQEGVARYPHDASLKATYLGQQSPSSDMVPLTAALLAKDEFLTQLLIKNGAAPDFIHDVLSNIKKNEFNEVNLQTVLEFADKMGVLDRALAQKNPQGDFPLHTAVKLFGRESDEVALLLENGANPNALNAERKTYAQTLSYMEEGAIENGAVFSNLIRQFIANNYEIRSMLDGQDKDERVQYSQILWEDINNKLGKYADDPQLKGLFLNQRTEISNLPLTQAIYSGDLALTNLLIENGAKPEFLPELMDLVFKGEMEISVFNQIIQFANQAKILDVALSQKDDKGDYPLHTAAKLFGKESEVVQILLASGADPVLENADGETYDGMNKDP